jgi:hypothetical protein
LRDSNEYSFIFGFDINLNYKIMKKTNSLGVVLLYALLTSIFFATISTWAWEVLDPKVIVGIMAALAVVCLVLMFTESGRSAR